MLADHVQTMAEVGYGCSRQETINLASDYAIYMGLGDKEHPQSDRWLYNFLQRRPDLKLKKPRSLGEERAKYAIGDAIDNYFNELNRILYI